jgi:phosphoribulokinase
MDPSVPSIAPRVAATAATGLRPVLLALAGDSASGKSTLSRGIEFILGVDRVGRVCTDDYHRFDRATRAEMGVTPLAPDANRMDLMADHLRELAAGRSVTKPTYDHHTGSFGPEERVAPGEIVIVEGLLPLADRGVRDAIDVAVFLEPEEELRRKWKLERDVFERGYSPKEVVDEIHRREADVAQYVRPQREYADVIVRFHRSDSEEDDRLSARLLVRPTLPFPALRELVGSFTLRGNTRGSTRGNTRGVEPVRWSTRTDRRGPLSVLEIDGDCPSDIGAELEEALWSSLHPDERLRRDRIGVIRHPGRGEDRSEALALAQLLIVSHLVGAFDGAFEL